MSEGLKNFIGGAFVPPASGEWLENRAPATDTPLPGVPDSSEADVDAAVAAATSAFPGWSATSTSDRAAVLEALADAIEARLDEFAETESRDQGKPVSLARRLDIPRSAENFRFFARAAQMSTDRAFSMPGAMSYSLRQPVGVAGLISPWNLPLYLLTWKIAPAIATGNTCVAKPSEVTPMTAALLAEACQAAGVPEGVVNLVHGSGSKAGAALVAHPEVPLVSFTGGTETGARVAASAAPMFKKLSLELGGKNPTLIFADADPEAAAAGALRAAFTNQGEICLCGSRILVQRPLYEEMLARLVAGAEKLVVGDPAAAETDLGALVSAAHRDKVRGYVELAREEGGVVACGGEAPTLPAPFDAGFFFRPTLITGLDPACRVQQEEIFGPVATVTPFDTEEEGLAIANGTRYGLAASVWTRDLARAHRVAALIKAGTVWLNSWMIRDLRVPFGGVKQSGVGREGGDDSLRFFTEAKTVCLPR